MTEVGPLGAAALVFIVIAGVMGACSMTKAIRRAELHRRVRGRAGASF
ncbi:MAG: hypothetical protein M3N53_08840 [Actinomycetota bacterium]|nr:hypothetical protein [Actinomycetota bacterium]